MNNTNSSMELFLSNKYLQKIVAIPVILLSLRVYINTLTSDIGWSDSAEFALQAFQLGVTHPPGYPVHTILGRFFSAFTKEPSSATILLSAVSTALTIGVLYLTTLELTGSLLVSIFAPFIFAFTSPIWDMAVVTEIYNLNTLLLSISLLAIIIWRNEQYTWVLILVGLVFGISLGTGLGNLLLLPAFVVYIYRQDKPGIRNLSVFLLTILITSFPILLYSMIRSFTHPPLGTQYLPTSFSGALKYFSGYQYGTLSIREFSFYIDRTAEHTKIITDNLLLVGMFFTTLGIFSQWKKDRNTALFFLILLITNLLYFTYYPVRDYTVMVAVSYYLSAIWMAFGFDILYRLEWRNYNILFKMAAIIALIILVVYQFNSQYDMRLEIKHRDRAERFTREAFTAIPEDSAVLGNWSVVTPLLYYQKTHSTRPDLMIIECNSKTRYYDFGTVANCWDFIDANIGKRPVVIEERYQDLIKDRYSFSAISQNWYLLSYPEPE